MSIYLVQSEDVSFEDVKLHPLPRIIWEKATRLLEYYKDGSKVVFFSAFIGYHRHDYLIEKINQNDFNYFYLIANPTDYSIYEWDVSIKRL